MADIMNESIHSAVRSGNIQRVKKCIQRNPLLVINIDLDENLNSPLHLIYDHVCPGNGNFQADNRLPIMELLITWGANVNSRNKDSMTPLHLAVIKNQINGIKLLLKNKANPNIIDNKNRTAVILSIVFGYRYNREGEILNMLLDYGADPNITNFYGETPLDIAFIHRRWDYVQILLNTGTATVKNVFRTFLSILLSKGHFMLNEDNSTLTDYLWNYIEIIVNQIFNGSKFPISRFAYCCEVYNITSKNGRATAFFDSMRIRGVVVDYQDSALHLAVRKQNVKRINVLLTIEGTNINERNFYLETPLHLIFKKKCTFSNEIGRLLLDFGADWRAQNLIDETPFYLAVVNKNYLLVKLMLCKIARVDETTLGYDISNSPYLPICYTEDDVALHELLVAITVGCEIVIDRWLGEEHNIVGVCPQVVTMALAKAIEQNNYNIVKKLLEAGFRSDGRFPSHLFKSIKGDKIRLTCLLWEFNENMSLDKLSCDTLYSDSSKSEPNVLIYLLIFFNLICEYVKESLLDCMTLQVRFKWQSFLTAKLDKCKNDLLKMKEIKLSFVSAFDVITIKLDSFVKLLNDKELRDVCINKFLELQSLPELDYYLIALQYRLGSAIEKNLAINTTLYHFNETYENRSSRIDCIYLAAEIDGRILLNLNVTD